MTIKLIAKTETLLDFTDMPGKSQGSAFAQRLFDDNFTNYADSNEVLANQEVIEFAGRLCYESWSMPNPETATQSGYIENIIDHGHYSVLEHVSCTFYVEGVSRNLSHELIRHRHLSFSELSQRYVNMEDAKFVTPPALGGDTSPLEWAYEERYLKVVDRLALDAGVRGKKAREAARAYLPGGTETKFVVTGNLRAWRDVLGKRLSSHADAEMQDFARELHAILAKQYPDVFRDIEFQ